MFFKIFPNKKEKVKKTSQALKNTYCFEAVPLLVSVSKCNIR